MPSPRKVALPDYVRDAVQNVLRDLLAAGEISRAKLIAELASFGENLEEFQEEEVLRGHDITDVFITDAQALSKIIARGFSKNQEEAKAFYLYFTKHYPNLLEKEIKKEKMKKEEVLVKSAHVHFSGALLKDMTVAERLRGEYQLYRRSPFDPDDTFFACKFSIGGDSDFDCRFETSDNNGDSEATIVAAGKLVPLSNNTNRFIALFAAADGAGQFIFQFDQVTVYPTKRKVLQGIVMSAFGPSRSSAWPVYAVSSPTGAAPVIRKFGIDELQNMPADIREELDRGAVLWNEKFDVNVTRRRSPS